MFHNLELSIPGKAFIAGEYLAMVGGPALVAAVGPRFKLKVIYGKTGANPFHPDSPAGKLYVDNQEILCNLEIQFEDAHGGLGGWGGSTAEFALLLSLVNLRKSRQDIQLAEIEPRKFLQEYQKYSSKPNVRYQPSGVDLIGQLNGNLTYFDRSQGRLEQKNWPFKQIGFGLYQTGLKIKTHAHIESLLDFKTDQLKMAIEDIHLSLLKSDADQFVSGILSYGKALHQLGFVHEETQKLIQKLPQSKILAAKGCGALGADVLLVLYRKDSNQFDQLHQETQKLGLVLKATENSLSNGITCKYLNNIAMESWP